jgi:ubiquinone/menaquinone biosynthesis C-methylase UbiE
VLDIDSLQAKIKSDRLSMTTIRQIAWSLYGYLAWDKNRNTKMTGKILSVIITALKTNQMNETVLDAGCGTGYYAFKLSENGFFVTGVDFASGMIKVAKQKYSNERINYKISDLSKRLPFDNHCFNHAISISSLQAVPDPIFMLKELSRVVKKDGNIVLVHFGKPDIHKESITRQVQSQIAYIERPNFIERSLLYLKSISERNGFSTYWTIDELKLMIEQSQLSIRRIEKFGTILIIEIKNG